MIKRCIIFFCFIYFIYLYVDACNEAVCASIVSKCLITQSCKCDLRNCTCCKDCFNCLSNLYAECCPCVDMCPKPNNTRANLSTESHVGDIQDPIPTLFQSLVSEQDSLDRWLTLTFPVDHNVNAFKPISKEVLSIITQTNEQEVDPVKNSDIITVNCSVAYMTQCMPWNKCKISCQSMGAQSYRWFHNGCCECVGDKCHPYGLGESRCSQCPLPEVVQPDKVQQDVSVEQLDFGEDEENS